jgi:membrane-bound lytic murein transglycosylase D
MRRSIPAVLAALAVSLIQGPALAESSDPFFGPSSAPPQAPAPVLVTLPTGSTDQPAPAAQASEVDEASVVVGSFSVADGHDLTISSTSAWERIRFGFAMPVCTSPLVAEHLAYYLNHPDYIGRIVDRSRRYLYHVVEQVERRGMPTEIALLPMIESAYNPTAYSSARASGIWQFIPSTGRDFGLDQNRWYDERRDVLQATEAALDYLEKLYEMFGSWDLALAAYNAGEGTVGRAIARNAAEGRPTDYLSLNLPAETRNYVPKLQAVKNIIASPQRYGLSFNDVPNQPYFAAISTHRHMDTEAAARLAGIPIAEFVSLNPAYSRPVIMPGESRPLLVPVDKADAFQANLRDSRGPLVTWQAYTVSRKDRIDRVAAQFGMTSARLAEVNGLSPFGKLRPGQTLLVQGTGPATERVEETVAFVSAPAIAAADEPKRAGLAPRARATPIATAQAGKSASKAAPAAKFGSSKPAGSTSGKKAVAARDGKPSSKKTVLARAGR